MIVASSRMGLLRLAWPLLAADVCIKDSQGKPKSVLVMISDTCPECEAEHIDVQSLAFAKVGLRQGHAGRVHLHTTEQQQACLACVFGCAGIPL